VGDRKGRRGAFVISIIIRHLQILFCCVYVFDIQCYAAVEKLPIFTKKSGDKSIARKNEKHR